MIMGSYLPLTNFRNSIPRTLYGCHGQMRQKATLHTFFFHFSKLISYSPIHFVTKLETNFKNQNHTTHPKLWSFQEIFFKTLHQNLWNLKSPWESLTCFTNVSYITLLNTTMESKLIKTKFSKYFSQEHNHETLEFMRFSWRNKEEKC